MMTEKPSILGTILAIGSSHPFDSLFLLGDGSLPKHLDITYKKHTGGKLSQGGDLDGPLLPLMLTDEETDQNGSSRRKQQD